MKDDVSAVRQILEGAGNPLANAEEEITEQPEVAEEETEEPEVAEDEEGSEDPTEPGEDAEDGEGAEEVQEVADQYTVSSLAEAIGFTPEEMYDVEVPMGEGIEPMKLGQVKDRIKAAEGENHTLKEELESIKNQVGEQPQMPNMTNEMLEAQANIKALQMEYQQIDWDAAEKNDPGQAALAKQKYQEAFQIAQGQMNQAQQGMYAAQQERLRQAYPVMLEKIPAWKDQDTRRADQAKMKQLMLSEGFHESEVMSIGDPRTMKLIHELMTLREKTGALDKATEDAVRQVKKAPRVIGSGGRKAPIKKGKQIEELKKRARTAAPGKKAAAELDAVKAIMGVR